MSKSLPSTVVPDGSIPLVLAPGPDAPRFGPPAEAGEVGTLGPYRVQKLLGKGGMGAVYRALDQGLERPIALKVMLPRYATDAEASGRFRREARAAAAVKHDNVVTVYQVGEDRGTPFIAMEFLSGYPLDRYLDRKGRLTVAQALRVGAETASGLAAAHALGLVHRDIKPANLWLEAPQGRIKILDFGLAKPLNETRGGTELTGSGAVMGTPAYMSPEQARGQTLDGRSDLFSLGVVLYQLTTGQRPFDGPNPTACGIAIATEEPPPVRALNPDVPEPFAALIHRLLAKDQANRPQTAAEVARLLRDLERGAPAADLSQPPSKPAAPRVVYVPIQVTAYEPNPAAFENLNDSSDRTVPVAAARTLMRARPRTRFPLKPVAGVTLLAGAMVVVGVYALWPAKKERTPDDTAAAPAVAAVPARAQTPAPPNLQFARWAFDRNGGVTVDSAVGEITREADLPKAFRVTGVRLPPEYRLTDDDVDQFKLVGELVSIRCEGLTALTAVGFDRIGELPQAARLKHLELPSPKADRVTGLAKCRSLDNLTLSHTPLAGKLGFLAELTALHGLTVLNCDLTDSDLAALAGLKLQQVVLMNNRRLTAAALDHLTASAATLSILHLNVTGMDGSAARRLARFPNLANLSVGQLTWSEADVRELAALTQLRGLSIADTRPPLTDAALLPVVASNPRLTDLNAKGSHVTDALLDALSGHEKLTAVDVAGTKVTTPAVKRLMAERPGCRVRYDYVAAADPDRKLAEWAFSKGGSVRARGLNIDKEFTAATGLPPAHDLIVTAVSVMSYALTDADIELLAAAPGLTKVEGNGSVLTAAGLERLARGPGAARLQELWVNSPEMTDAGLAHLADFTALKNLSLCNGKGITGAGLKHLASLPKLERLNLCGTGVGDADLALLTDFKALKHLLIDFPVSDAGLDHLDACKSLVTLDLRGTKNLPPERVQAVRERLPKCTVFPLPPKP